jgi:hypothetical protein
MTTNSDKTTRRESPPIKVYCLREERRQIETKANAAGLSLSTYLLNVGTGYEIRGIADHKQVEELARINGDLGRLGGLLKLWLTDDQRTAEVGKATIRAVLWRIEATQNQMGDLINRVISSKRNGEF